MKKIQAFLVLILAVVFFGFQGVTVAEEVGALAKTADLVSADTLAGVPALQATDEEKKDEVKKEVEEAAAGSAVSDSLPAAAGDAQI